MRWWLVLVVAGAALAACGPSGRRTGAAGRAGASGHEAAPLVRDAPPGDAYEILTRTRASFAGHELATLRSRLEVWVARRSRRGRGLGLRARVHRLGADGAVAGFSDVEVVLDGRGALVHDAVSLCDDPDVDDLSPTRIVRHVLGSLAPWDGAEDGTLALEIAEDAFPVTLRAHRADGAIEARGSERIRLGPFTVGGWRVRIDGEAHVRIEQRLDPADALVARVRIEVEAMATVTDARGRARTGLLTLTSDVVSRAAERAAVPPPTCESGFSRDDVLREVDRHRDDLRGCYEAALRTDPTLRGVVRVAMTVLPLGEVGHVHVVSSELERAPAVDDCVVAALERLRFVEGPVGRPLVYELPLVFEPGTAAPSGRD